MGMKDHVHPRRQRGLVRWTEEGRLHDGEPLAVAGMVPLFQLGGGDGLCDGPGDVAGRGARLQGLLGPLDRKSVV